MNISRVFCKDAINKKLDTPIEEDLELDLPEGEEELDEAKKKKKKIKTTYTTGSIAANIDFFNKHNGTDDDAGKDAAADTNADMGQSGAIGGDGNGDAGSLSGGEGSGDSGASGEGASAGGAMGESLTEAKRYVKRYYIKPQNIFCSNKEEILKALIEYKDENLTVYTLVNLTDHEKDVTKLTNDDIIYYYYDGILYDKNHIRIMDYDLSIKHEEDRKKFTQEGDKLNMDNTEVKSEYEDRMTDANLSESINGVSAGDIFSVAQFRKNSPNCIKFLETNNGLVDGIICGCYVTSYNTSIATEAQTSFWKLIKVTDVTGIDGQTTLIAKLLGDNSKKEVKIPLTENALNYILVMQANALWKSAEFQAWAIDPEIIDSQYKASIKVAIREEVRVSIDKIISYFTTGFNISGEIPADEDTITSISELAKKAKEEANLLKSEKLLSAREWFLKNVEKVQFIVPVCSDEQQFIKRVTETLGYSTYDARKLISRWKGCDEKIHKLFNGKAREQKDIIYKDTETNKDVNREKTFDKNPNLIHLACNITFGGFLDNLAETMPPEVKNIIRELANPKEDTAAVLSRHKKQLSCLGLGLMLAEMVDYDLSQFEKTESSSTAAASNIVEENPFDQDFVDVDTWGIPIEEDFIEEPCVICGEPIVGYGNNAEPYKAGRCCDACNAKFVIPARLQQYIDYRGMED